MENRDLLVQRALADERPEATTPGQEPIGDDTQDCLPYWCEGHPEEPGQVSLGGQTFTRLKHAALDQIEQQLLNLRVQRKLRAASDQGRAGERCPALEGIVRQVGQGWWRRIDPDIMRS
jgi:hypothetical protein